MANWSKGIPAFTEQEDGSFVSTPDSGTCCICKQQYTNYGHDPEPIKNGKYDRCCSRCNNAVVIPAKKHIKKLISEVKA